MTSSPTANTTTLDMSRPITLTIITTSTITKRTITIITITTITAPTLAFRGWAW